MNTSEIVAQVAAGVEGLTKVQVAEVVADFLAVAYKALLEGHDVHLSGIGRLAQHSRPARNGRNPKTGEALAIPAKKLIKLSPVSELRDIKQ